MPQITKLLWLIPAIILYLVSVNFPKSYDGFVCWSQEKEYKEAVEALNEKNREKAQLLSRLMEVSYLIFRKSFIILKYANLVQVISTRTSVCSLITSISNHFHIHDLFQLVGESERLRMKKLEELNKHIETLR